MAQFTDLVNKYKGLLSQAGSNISSFVQKNPTPAGYLSSKINPPVSPVSSPLQQNFIQKNMPVFSTKVQDVAKQTLSSSIPISQFAGVNPSSTANFMKNAAQGYGTLLGSAAQTGVNRLLEPITKNPGTIKVIPEETIKQYSHDTPAGRLRPALQGGFQTVNAVLAAATPAMAANAPLNYLKSTVIGNAALQGTGNALRGIIEKTPFVEVAKNVFKASLGDSKVAGPISGLFGDTPLTVTADTVLGLAGPLFIGFKDTKSAKEFEQLRDPNTGRYTVQAVKKFAKDHTNFTVLDTDGQKISIGEYMKKHGYTDQSGFIDFGAEVNIPKQSVSNELQDAWNTARTKGVKNPERLDPDELGNIIDPNFVMADTTNTIGDKISALQKEYQSVRETGGTTVPIIPPGQKERKFVTTVRNADTTAPPVAEKVQGTYTPITNKETLGTAQKVIDVDYDAAKARVFNEPLTPETNAIGQDIMRRAQNEGRYEEAVEIAEELARKGTQAGQTVQAFSTWSRLTPEGMLRHVTKTFDEANKKMDVVTKTVRNIRGMDKVKLDEATAEYVTKAMKRAQAATDEGEKAKIIKEMFEVVNKKLPWGVWDIVDEYRYNNMLSNPLTHLRNVSSNLMNTYLIRPGTLAVSGKPLDAIKYEAGALGAIPEALVKAFKTFKEGKPIEKLDNVDLTKYKPQRLPVLLGAPSRLLQSADDFFSTLIQAGEKARGANAEDAFKTARYTLFQQDLKPQGQGVVLNKIDDLTRAVYGLRRVGLGWFIPFIKTPMNVAKQWIEYSPLGVATLPGAANKKEQVAKMLMGSMVSVVGAKMAMEDRTTWSAPTDTKAKELFYASGKKPFSVKIGDKWVPMQAFGTLAYAMALPAAVKQYQEDSRTALTDSQIEKLTQAAMGGLQFFSQQTFVSGLGSFVNLARGDVDFTLSKNLAYTAGQLIPLAGLQRYVANIVDPVYRKPSGVVEQLKSGIPFLTKGIEPYTDPYGDPSKRLPINNVVPYAVGQQNNEFEEPLQMRNQQLQLNNVINKQKKDLEQGSLGGIDKVQAAEEAPANKQVIMDQYRKKAEEDMARAKAEIKGGLQETADKIFYTNENGNVVSVYKDRPIEQPKLTGNAELDKKLISSYKSSISSKANDIVKLYELGEYTELEAEKKLQELKSKSTLYSKPKKGKRITIKQVKVPKIKVAKIKKIKIPKLKSVKKYKLKTPKLKKSRVKLTARLT